MYLLTMKWEPVMVGISVSKSDGTIRVIEFPENVIPAIGDKIITETNYGATETVVVKARNFIFTQNPDDRNELKRIELVCEII